MNSKTIKINLLGEEIEIKKLSVGDMFKLQSLNDADEATQFFNIISMAMVKPAMSIEEVYNIEAKYMDDLSKIVEIATKQE